MKNTTAHSWLTGNGPVEKEKSRMPERKRGVSEPSPWQGGREWASGTGEALALGAEDRRCVQVRTGRGETSMPLSAATFQWDRGNPELGQHVGWRVC